MQEPVEQALKEEEQRRQEEEKAKNTWIPKKSYEDYDGQIDCLAYAKWRYENATGKPLNTESYSSTDYHAATPGAVVCWNGHFAVVEEVTEGGIVISESSNGGLWYMTAQVPYPTSNGVIYNYYGPAANNCGSTFLPWELVQVNGAAGQSFLGYVYP